MKELFQLLGKYELTPNGYYMLYCLDNNLNMELPVAYSTEMHRLKLQGYLDERSGITKAAKTVLVELAKCKMSKAKEPKIMVSSDFAENLARYRELFPPLKAAGRALRNSIPDLEARMVWFMRSYPQYGWDIILTATTKYIESFSGEFKYCNNSAYFIKKDDKSKVSMSNLATWCESVNEADDSAPNPILDFNRMA